MNPNSVIKYIFFISYFIISILQIQLSNTFFFSQLCVSAGLKQHIVLPTALAMIPILCTFNVREYDLRFVYHENKFYSTSLSRIAEPEQILL